MDETCARCGRRLDGVPVGKRCPTCGAKRRINELQLGGEVRPAGALAIAIRSYFSTYLLWSAWHEGALAQRVEDAHEGKSRFDWAHRGHVLAGVFAAVGFLEALINEQFQDAHDGHRSSISNLGQEANSRMALVWQTTGGRGQVLEKYDWSLAATDRAQMDRGGEPYQSARLVVKLRNDIAHYRPEQVSAAWEHPMNALRGRFPENRLMSGSGNAWWPDHCLGAGCVAWAASSAERFANHICAAVGISPNYQHLEKSLGTSWRQSATNP